VTTPDPVDDVDRRILDCLRMNARESAADIAKRVNLTPSAVRRRIAGLEKAGVITGYTVAINHDLVGASVEAYIELSFAGNADVHSILADAMRRPQVREAMTIAGDLDALLRVRVRNLAELREIVMALRTSGPVTGSRTRVVLGRWWHGSVPNVVPDDA
jgi:Lrp/AsnC family transcriptional regulator, leucine-responsive regulatory protein